LITAPEDLNALIDRLRAIGCFAYDTEFIGEMSYSPNLCLVQVATTEEVVIIDPFELDLEPFWLLIADPDVAKIVHAGAQDLEPVVRLYDRAPQNIFDTQICAGFLNLPYPLSLQKIVRVFAGVRLGKAQTFTRWDMRPLSARHLGYAADDVRYLPLLYDELTRALKTRGYEDFARKECDALSQKNNYIFDAERQVTRVIKTDHVAPRVRAILTELVSWRDEVARSKDVPPRSLLKDEVLVRIAKDATEDVDALARIRDMPTPLARSHGEAILAAVERGASATPSGGHGRSERHEETVQQRAELDRLWALVSAYCLGRGIDTGLITSRNDLSLFLNSRRKGRQATGLRMLAGWRSEFIGPLLGDVLDGEMDVTLRWSKGGLEADELGPEEPDSQESSE
jgi:ribonuclease D